jgi:hypothetical protein
MGLPWGNQRTEVLDAMRFSTFHADRLTATPARSAPRRLLAALLLLAPALPGAPAGGGDAVAPAAPASSAPSAPHWAFIPPRRPPVPEVERADWPRGAIDRFVLAGLERAALAPSPPAPRTTLIRRATLDLTGLPPAPAEVDAFLADPAPDAYEKLVGRLLASPRRGEHLAGVWLDAARYADTSGYQTDGPRDMWRWRDWVIDAYNRDQPFDRFTLEQIAGDMLPGATLEQRIATGFNRNHRGNSEGGIVPEEYQVEYVADRVDTTATVWLGLTLGCARCHDHKYDPISQEEFYRVFACFNNIPEHGRALKVGNSAPYIAAPTAEEVERISRLERLLAAAEAERLRLEPALAAAQAAWEAFAGRAAPVASIVTAGLVSHYALDGNTLEEGSLKGEAAGRGAPGTFQDGEPAYVPGRIGQAASLDGRRFIDLGDAASFGYFDRFSFGAWIRPEGAAGGAVLSRMGDSAESDGHNLHVEEGKVQVNLVKRWLDDAIRVETVAALEPGRWHHVMATYDGSRRAEGVKVYVDGEPRELRVLVDELNQSFTAKEPLRIGSRGTRDRFHGAIDDVRIYARCLDAGEVEILATAAPIEAILALPPGERSGAEARKLRACFLAVDAPEPIREAHARAADLRRRRLEAEESVSTVMVMEEMATPRETHILERGAYDRPGKKVLPGIPACLAPPPAAAGVRDRLGLARWIAGDSNPLTARVAVNRLWQRLFGTGLVRTAEDFGTRGEPPSHPLLLDWLAVELVRRGWDLEGLEREIVLTATYRQSSLASPALLAADPENRLLARGPRFRLSAAAVRDQALAASGLLVERLGGPPVKPYQPAGIWEEMCDQVYEEGSGEDLYRRSLYTFWKRTATPPLMATLDASAREACSVRETRTNTPLQALALMNDTAFVEAARALAERVLAEEGCSTPPERLAHAFRLVIARRPSAAEARILEEGFRRHRDRYRGDPASAEKLLAVGEHRPPPGLDAVELAAYAITSSLILNLDEAVTRE